MPVSAVPEPIEHEIVMKHHGFAISPELNVALDAEVPSMAASRGRHVSIRPSAGRAGRDGRSAGRQASWRGEARSSAISNIPQPRRSVRRQFGDADGGAAVAAPVAETSTIRSDAPFMTGGRRGTGAASTKPPSRTQRSTRRDPRARLCLRQDVDAADARRRARLGDKPAPSLPLCSSSLPSAPRQSCPETTIRLPVRTNGHVIGHRGRRPRAARCPVPPVSARPCPPCFVPVVEISSARRVHVEAGRALFRASCRHMQASRERTARLLHSWPRQPVQGGPQFYVKRP